MNNTVLFPENPIGVDHSYYCSGSEHREFNSWDDFISEWDNADMDYNCLFRWDWWGNEHCEKPPVIDVIDGESFEKPVHILKIIYIIQRKGYIIENTVYVTEDDAPRIKKWLEPHWENMKKLWEPFSNETK